MDANHPLRFDRDFWDQYIAFVRESGAKSAHLRWYVRHVERYLKAVDKPEPSAHLKSDLEGYLAKIGRNSRVNHWQFVQIVEAIRILLVHQVRIPRIHLSPSFDSKFNKEDVSRHADTGAFIDYGDESVYRYAMNANHINQ